MTQNATFDSTGTPLVTSCQQSPAMACGMRRPGARLSVLASQSNSLRDGPIRSLRAEAIGQSAPHSDSAIRDICRKQPTLTSFLGLCRMVISSTISRFANQTNNQRRSGRGGCQRCLPVPREPV